MGYQYIQPAKVIEITPNKEKVLKILEDVLLSCGLSAKDDKTRPAIEDLIPGGIDDAKGLLQTIVGASEKLSFFKSVFGKEGRLLRSTSAEVTDVGKKLLDEYTDDWVKDLSEEFSSEKMESHHIEASRILIMELFIRIVMQSVRLDDKLPKDGKFDRKIWSVVLVKFAKAIVSKSSEIEVDKHFFIHLEKIHVKWSEWIKYAIVDTNEIDLAKKVISQNLENIEARKVQIQRYIYIALLGHEGAKTAKEGCLASRQLRLYIEKAQDEILKKIEDSKSKSKSSDKGKQMVLIPEDNAIIIDTDTPKNNIIRYREIPINQSKWLDKSKIKTQNKVCNYKKDELLKKYYALLNFTQLIVKYIEQIDTIIHLGNWSTLLMGLMDLSKIDQLLRLHQKVYKEIIKLDADPYNIEKTGLRAELSLYNIDDADRDVKELAGMSQLQNKDILIRIADKFTDTFNGIVEIGNLLCCGIMPDDMNTRKVYENEGDKMDSAMDSYRASKAALDNPYREGAAHTSSTNYGSSMVMFPQLSSNSQNTMALVSENTNPIKQITQLMSVMDSKFAEMKRDLSAVPVNKI